MKLAVLNALVSLFVVAVGIAAYHHTIRSPADRIGVIDVTEVYRLKEKEFTDLVTKADLAATKTELEQAIERSEHRLTLRLIGIVGAFDAALFALLRFVH